MRDLLALADDEARDRWDRLALGYTESPGDPALRAAIAGLYEHVSPDQVLVFSGAPEASQFGFWHPAGAKRTVTCPIAGTRPTSSSRFPIRPFLGGSLGNRTADKLHWSGTAGQAQDRATHRRAGERRRAATSGDERLRAPASGESG